MLTVLVVWEEIPEDKLFYAVPMTAAEYDMISKCHGKYIGGIGREYWKFFDLLQEKLDKATQLDSSKPIDLNGYSLLILTGIIL